MNCRMIEHKKDLKRDFVYEMEGGYGFFRKIK